MPSAVTARSRLSCVNHHNSAIHWRHLAWVDDTRSPGEKFEKKSIKIHDGVLVELELHDNATTGGWIILKSNKTSVAKIDLSLLLALASVLLQIFILREHWAGKTNGRPSFFCYNYK